MLILDQYLGTIYFFWQHVLQLHTEFLYKVDCTGYINDNFMLFVRELGLIVGAFYVIGESTIKRFVECLHLEVKKLNLNLSILFVLFSIG